MVALAPPLRILAGIGLFLLGLFAEAQANETRPVARIEAMSSKALGLERSLRPNIRTLLVPKARWDHRSRGRAWTISALEAFRTHGRPVLEVVPKDFRNWCPAYPDLSTSERAAFWTALLSALAKHESTYREEAVGGNGRWYGLLQILPATARGYQCTDPTRQGLKVGERNLSCAIRILAVTVPRDGVIAAKDTRWRGVAADWGPMRRDAKRTEMAAWTRRQPYCRTLDMVRPRLRPE